MFVEIKKYSFYPWAITIFACAMMIVSNGMMITGLSIYDEAILNELQWTLSEYKFSGLISLGVAGICAPMAGYIIDKFGTRVCILTGWMTLALAYLGFSQVTVLYQFYLVHAVFGITLTLIGLNVAVVITSSWMSIKRRGISVGIAIAGSSFGGILFPQFAKFMLLSYEDWRLVLAITALFPLGMLIFSYLFVHDSVKGVNNKEDQQTSAVPLEGISYKDALKMPSFWALVVIACTTFFTLLGAQGHLFLYTRSLGFSVENAANTISLFFALSLIGKLVFGFFADYFPIKRVLYGNMTIMLIGAFLLVLMNPSMVIYGMALFGLGWGGVYTLIQYSVVSIFGIKEIGKIIGTITMFDAISGGFGIYLSGYIRSINDNYQPVFIVYFVMLIIAFLAIPFVRKK